MVEKNLSSIIASNISSNNFDFSLKDINLNLNGKVSVNDFIIYNKEKDTVLYAKSFSASPTELVNYINNEKSSFKSLNLNGGFINANNFNSSVLLTSNQNGLEIVDNFKFVSIQNIGITDFDIEPDLEVETWWDLGMNDSTVITFAQRHGDEVRIIDCYENSGEGLEHYMNVIDEKPYTYSKHIAPHDIRVREIGTNKSRWETAKEMGLEFDIAPKLSVEDGIEQVRRMLPKCYFHKSNCKKLIEALKSYCKRWDEKNNCFRNKPLHNWASHFCDSVRYGAIVEPVERSDWSKPIRVDTNYIV